MEGKNPRPHLQGPHRISPRAAPKTSYPGPLTAHPQALGVYIEGPKEPLLPFQAGTPPAPPLLLQLILKSATDRWETVPVHVWYACTRLLR